MATWEPLDVVSLHARWVSIHSRCKNPAAKGYDRYGGRGITVCSEWNDFNAFFFWSIENGYHRDLQLDREDNDGPYSPDNCRWVTRTKNARNKSTNRVLTAFGETKTWVEWAEDPRCVVDYHSLGYRLRGGWPGEEALTQEAIPFNQKRFAAFGESRNLKSWARDPRCVVSYQTLQKRVRAQGWDLVKAMQTPSLTEGASRVNWGGRTELTAFGETKTANEWVQDPRCTVTLGGLRKRILEHHMTPETAITARNRRPSRYCALSE